MKNLLLSVLFLLTASLVFGQTNYAPVTVTNAGTGIVTVASTGTNQSLAVQATIAKTSGTLAGTVTLQQSLNDTLYTTVPTAAVTGAASTFTVTDVASQGVVFIIPNPAAKFYRLSWTGTGTMVGVLRARSIVKEAR